MRAENAEGAFLLWYKRDWQTLATLATLAISIHDSLDPLSRSRDPDAFLSFSAQKEKFTQKITMVFRIIFLLSMLSTTFAAAAPSIESASDGSVIISVAEGATVMVQELDANGKVIGCASNLFLFVFSFPFPSP